jgi:hypothetical protein
MVGNVWEWAEDCYNEQLYAGAPTDGSPLIIGNCYRLIARGGSWYSSSGVLRLTARRQWFDFNLRNNDIGFRVARTLAAPAPLSANLTPDNPPAVPSVDIGVFEGKWIMRENKEPIFFHRSSDGVNMDTWLQKLGKAVVRTSDAAGSNIIIVGEFVSCRYNVSIVNATQMAWRSRGGNDFAVCPGSDVLTKVP